jgi:peptidoglycan lytic transglycosylase
MPRTMSLRGRRAGALAGALCFATTISAAAPGAAQTTAPAQGAATTARPATADLERTRLRTDVLAGRRATVRGVVRPALAGQRVVAQRRAGDGWRTVARATTGRGGRFTLRWRTGRPRSAQLRVRVLRSERVRAARRVVGRLNVYRRAQASWYGPGLYGNALGCGGRLAPGTLGVAHKTLPCGSKVTLRHEGRTVRVRVVDRGPYVGDREFDLTAATKARLGFGSTGAVLVTR